MTQAFTFDQETHTYADRGGVEVPSVTQIISNYGLVNYDGIDPEVLRAKGILGDIVHEATTFVDDGTIDWSTVHPKIAPRIRAYEKFKAESGLRFIPGQTEKRRIATVNGMRFGMTIDRDCFINGKPHVLELKCSANEERWWGVQLAAYEAGLRAEDRVFRQRLAVQLKPDGTYRTFYYGDAIDLQVFMWALGIE